MEQPILLSVVATSRNDNHGKNLLYRMQHFVNGFIEQCKKHDLIAELILVDWNPPDGKPSLAEVLHFPINNGPCSIRIIQVPKEVHSTLDNSEKIPLFQMIAKNVGIRRAKGEFVLATNIDVLFSDQLMKFIKYNLKSNHLYRVDRLDVPEELPSNTTFKEILHFCALNYFRINSKTGTIYPKKKSFLDILKNRKFSNIYLLRFIHNKSFNALFSRFFKIIKIFLDISIMDITIALTKIPFSKIRKFIKKSIIYFYPNTSLFPHTNACGDFTLLSYDDWFKLKGYPEWNIFSWHIDSVLLYQAKQHGIKELDLPRKMAIYHIEHEIGSGYSQEGAQTLFSRLEAKGIPYLSNTELKQLITKLKKSNQKVVYNRDDWGFSNILLKEFIPNPTNNTKYQK